MYKVRIEQFEGPFDLLVYLIENARMDIYDIRVAEITEQYIDYLKEMEELSIEVGSEFIVLAAVLIRLKSRMLLPRADADGELQIEEDPRAELVSRLQDYMRTKKIAEMLQEREEYCLNIHVKPGEFLAFLEKRKRLADVRKRYERVRRERSSVEDRIRQMTSILNRKLARGGKVLFTELIPEQADRYDVTLSFLSLLEMIKAQEVDAKQQQLYGEIEVTKHGQGGNNG